MSVIEKLKADFLPRAKEIKSCKIKLSESCEEITVYYRPVVNTVQSDKYMPLLADNKMEGYVELLIARARNEDGRTAMFKPADKADLMKNVDPAHIVEIGNIIIGADVDNGPEAEKEAAEIAKK